MRILLQMDGVIKRVGIISAVLIVAVVGGFFAVTFLAFPIRYRDEVMAASARFDVDPVLVMSVIRAESRFRPDSVSSAGAVGLMQLMPATADYVAEKLGMELGSRDLFDPSINITLGVFYLRYLLDRFGDVRTAVAAYNAGEGNVAMWLKDDPALSRIPFGETSRYVQRVFGAMGFYGWRV